MLAAGNPDPAKFVPIEAMTAMQSQIAALTAKFQTGEVNDVVTVALKKVACASTRILGA
jgi:phage I-like protein